MEENQNTLIRVRNLSTVFPIKQTIFEKIKKKPQKAVRAVSDVSLDIRKGETVGLVGESGCGKSTLARTLIRLCEPSRGTIEYEGIGDLGKAGKQELAKLHRQMQMIFQDPYSSLNPRMSIRSMFYEILSVYHLCEKKDYEKKTKEILELVGMPQEVLDRRPSAFSGGQRQRIGIARALVMNPEVLILTDLKERLRLTMLFISHDLRVVRYISDRVVVMYLGKIMEEGETESLFQSPGHPYTNILIHAAPVMNPEIRERSYTIEGETPSPIDTPSGCLFHPRCPYATEECGKKIPELKMYRMKDGSIRKIACHFPLDREELTDAD